MAFDVEVKKDRIRQIVNVKNIIIWRVVHRGIGDQLVNCKDRFSVMSPAGYQLKIQQTLKSYCVILVF